MEAKLWMLLIENINAIVLGYYRNEGEVCAPGANS